MGTSGVTGEDAGLASGLFNTAQQVGGSLGLAILSTLAASQTTSLLRVPGRAATQAGHVSALVSGYHVAFLAAAIMLAIGVVLLAVGLRRRHMRDVEAAIETGAALPVAA